MPFYVAFLRGVTPMNAKMSDLRTCFEAAGFTEVRTVLSSGNVVFNTRATSEASVESRAEAAMRKHLGRAFFTISRPVEALRKLHASDPYEAFRLPNGAKRVVSFLRQQPTFKLALPIELDGAWILHLENRAVFSAYVPSRRGAVFMTLIERTFGKEVTTRTWDTVRKVTQ